MRPEIKEAILQALHEVIEDREAWIGRIWPQKAEDVELELAQFRSAKQWVEKGWVE